MTTSLILLSLTAVLMPLQTKAHSLDQTSAVIAKIVFTQDFSNISNEDLAGALRQLKEQTRRLKQDLTSSQDEMDSGSRTKFSTALDLTSTADHDADHSADYPADHAVKRSANHPVKHSAKVDEIRRNIRLLKTLFDEKKRRQAIADKDKNDADATAAEMDLKGSSTKSSEIITPVIPSNLLDSGQAGPSDAKPDGRAASPVGVPKQVVHRIVDAFELGNSLFLADKLERAIKYYEAVPTDQLSAFDRNWLELMMACCHRRRGDYDLAEHSYRTVANDKHGLRASGAAKDWLKYLAKRKRMVSVVDEYTARADAVIQKAESLLGGEENGSSN